MSMGSSNSGDDMPDFSDVVSGASSKAAETQATYKMYSIVSGDSLSKIAKREYGNANAWTKIFEANKDVIKDPNKIFPGQKIKIPL
jgi:nucleoid-associated protein YgaU